MERTAGVERRSWHRNQRSGAGGGFGAAGLYLRLSPGYRQQVSDLCSAGDRNAMVDYIRSYNLTFEAKNLGNIIRLDEVAKDENRGKREYIADPTKQTPEQIYLAQERIDDIHHALDMIESREEYYLRYRFGFDDDIEHPLTETAKHFRLSESRARYTEALALDNVWLELPWWY